MSLKSIEDDRGARWVVDTSSGECLLTRKGRSVRHGTHDKYVGIETVWPLEAVTADAFLDSVRVLDGYIDSPARVNREHILESLLKGNITQQGAQLVMWMADHVAGWNRWYGTHQSLLHSGVKERTIRSVMSAMEGSTIKAVADGVPSRGKLVVEIHPYIVWKGDLMYRENALRRWASGCINSRNGE